MNAALQRLETFLEARGLPCSSDVIGRFETFLTLLEKARSAMNLIGRLEPRQVVDELVCDSLQILVLRSPPRVPVIDVGSGAGFPGIPIKLVFPQVPLVLVEPRERRQAFLAHVVRTLALDDVTRVRARIEDAEVPAGGLVCSKAFAPIPRWLEVASTLVRRDGDVTVLASQQDWAQLQLGELLHRWKLVRRIDYAWPGSAPRVAVLLAPDLEPTGA